MRVWETNNKVASAYEAVRIDLLNQKTFASALDVLADRDIPVELNPNMSFKGSILTTFDDGVGLVALINLGHNVLDKTWEIPSSTNPQEALKCTHRDTYEPIFDTVKEQAQYCLRKYGDTAIITFKLDTGRYLGSNPFEEKHD